MVPVFSALARALRDLVQPRVLAVLFLPMLGAILAWSMLAWLFWDAWVDALRSLVDVTAAAKWLATRGLSWILDSSAVLIVIVLLVPAILVTAIVITEFVAMPVIVSVVARGYPALERRSGGTVAGSVGNAALTVAVFALLWIVTLPLWLTGIGALIVPALNSAYLNQRLFRYDALAEHASREEYATLVKHDRLALFGLGLLLAPLFYVPFVNLIAPVTAGLAFTHYCLAALVRLRSTATKS